MAEKKLIDAAALKKSLEQAFESGCIQTEQDVEDCIDAMPAVQRECSCRKWHPASETPPLHHVREDDDEEPLEYEASEKMLVYTENGRIVANVRYVRSENFVGWDDWSGGLYNTNVTHWMPQPTKPMEEKRG